jgi:hypothetical protein
MQPSYLKDGYQWTDILDNGTPTVLNLNATWALLLQPSFQIKVKGRYPSGLKEKTVALYDRTLNSFRGFFS